MRGRSKVVGGDEKMLVDSKWCELELRCNYVIKNQKTRQNRFPRSIHETKTGSLVETRSLLFLPRISSGEGLLAAKNERYVLVGPVEDGVNAFNAWPIFVRP